MRATLFRGGFVVLGLGLLGAGLLVLLAHRFKAKVDRPGPWSPPELAVAGIPADPTQALQALAVYDPPSDCQSQELIDEDEEEGEAVHRHTIVPAKTLERLEGQAEKILPYLVHSSEPVVYRAATLLCFIQDGPSRQGLEWLASHYPCRSWVIRFQSGAGMEPRIANCSQAEPRAGYDLLDAIPYDTSKPSPEALALARRISEGDATAVHQALQATQAMESARRVEGGQALMNVSTSQGLALVFQALLEGWEAKLLSFSTISGGPKWEWKPEQLFKGVSHAALFKVVAQTGHSYEQVFMEAVGLLPESLMESIIPLVRAESSLYGDIGRLAHSPAGQEVKSATARALMERIYQETSEKRARRLEAEARQITELYRAGDLESLKRVMVFHQLTGFHRLLAACYLVGLGEDSALGWLEYPPRMPPADRNAIRSEVKQLLDRAKPGATKKHLQRIYDKLSEPCRLEDCSIESPR